jgi:pilus assembly protein CpaB
MGRFRIGTAMLIAVLVALGTSYFVYKQMKQVTAEAKPVPMGQLLVAARPLQLGTRLQPQYLRVIPWPKNQPAQGMLTRVDQAVDRALITPVVENEPILEANLAPTEAGAGLPAVIPEGMRAMSVAVNNVVAVAGFVVPGTFVDVIATGSPRNGSGETVTRTILENIRVLAAGQQIQQDKDGKPQTVPVITLLVKPDEADRLTMASTQGRIQLALRNTIDTKETSPPPVLDASVFGIPRPEYVRRSGPVKPSTSPRPAFVVEVIRGDKREEKTF